MASYCSQLQVVLIQGYSTNVLAPMCYAFKAGTNVLSHQCAHRTVFVPMYQLAYNCVVLRLA